MEVKIDYKDGTSSSGVLVPERTDFELIVKFFLNPYWWFRFKIIYQKGSEWGIIMGPVLLAVFKFKIFRLEYEQKD